MISLEKQVVSLELAQKMKTLGAPQEGLFWWFRIWNDTYELGDTLTQMERGKQMSNLSSTDKTPIFDTFVAYTVAELGEMLPEVLNGTQLSTWKCMGVWHCGNDRDVPKAANTEADARAKMWVYLKENELI